MKQLIRRSKMINITTTKVATEAHIMDACSAQRARQLVVDKIVQRITRIVRGRCIGRSRGGCLLQHMRQAAGDASAGGAAAELHTVTLAAPDGRWRLLEPHWAVYSCNTSTHQGEMRNSPQQYTKEWRETTTTTASNITS